MTKLKKFVSTYNKIIFVLTLVLALTSIICSAVISYNTSYIEAHALTVEHHHEHLEHVHAEEVQITAYNVVPNLGNAQKVTAGDNKDYKWNELPTVCPNADCTCTVKGCSKCYTITEVTKDNETYKNYKNTCTATKDKPCPLNITAQDWYKNMMQITDLVDQILTPVLIILGTAGSIFVIVLGINFSKAESADKREEAKKRMINAIIGIVVTLLFLILVKLFTANADSVVKFVNGVA